MKQKPIAGRIAHWKAVVGLLVVAAGVGTGCTNKELDAVLAGIQVAAEELSDNQDDNITLGDWLASELSSN